VLYAPYLPPQSISAPLANDTKSCDEAKAVAAIGFAVKFVGDLAVNFNSQISQHALRLANLAPPAPFACFLAVEHMHVVEGDLPDSSERYLEIFETLKTFGKRWKVAGSCPSWCFASHYSVANVLQPICLTSLLYVAGQ